MAVNLAQIQSLLKPGLMSLTGGYKDYPQIWNQIFTTRKSQMNTEQSVSMAYLGLPTFKQDGGPTTFDNNAGQRFTYNYQNLEVALAYAITRQSIEDNLYKAQFRPMQLGLQKSFRQFKEIQGANVLNTGTTYNPAIGGDGVALFSTAHPIDGGTVANTPTVQVDLNESSLLNAQIVINSTFKDNRGLLVNARGQKLLIPPNLEPVAVRLIKTELRPGTSDNDVNAVPIVAGGIKEYVVDPFFSSSYAWFVQTDIEGLYHLDRMPFETDTFPDFTTDNLLVKARERYCFGYEDWRAVWGSFPTS